MQRDSINKGSNASSNRPVGSKDLIILDQLYGKARLSRLNLFEMNKKNLITGGEQKTRLVDSSKQLKDKEVMWNKESSAPKLLAKQLISTKELGSTQISS